MRSIHADPYNLFSPKENLLPKALYVKGHSKLFAAVLCLASLEVSIILLLRVLEEAQL